MWWSLRPSEDSMDDHESVAIANVEALSVERGLVCTVAGVCVTVPRRCIRRCSEVRRPGDRGTLITSVWHARMLGLAKLATPVVVP
jgi:hypothetical protein